MVRRSVRAAWRVSFVPERALGEAPVRGMQEEQQREGEGREAICGPTMCFPNPTAPRLCLRRSSDDAAKGSKEGKGLLLSNLRTGSPPSRRFDGHSGLFQEVASVLHVESPPFPRCRVGGARGPKQTLSSCEN